MVCNLFNKVFIQSCKWIQLFIVLSTTINFYVCFLRKIWIKAFFPPINSFTQFFEEIGLRVDYWTPLTKKKNNQNFHEWKIIPSHLINKYFGKSFKFHSCLSFDRKLLIKFPKFYKNILFQWSSSFFVSSELPFCIFYGLINIFQLKKSPSFFVIFLTKDSTLSTNYLITMEMLNLGAVLKKNSALAIFRTLNGNN